VSFFLGATILFDSPLPGGGIPLSSIIAMILVVLAFVFLVVRSVVNVHRMRASTGMEGMIGEEGIAISDFSGNGRISVHGEIWNAEIQGYVAKGDKVIVEHVKGMVLTVRKK